MSVFIKMGRSTGWNGGLMLNTIQLRLICIIWENPLWAMNWFMKQVNKEF